MIRRVEVKVPRRGFVDTDQIRIAFLEAHNEFIHEFGRSPNYSGGHVIFGGGFTEHHITFEIIEEEDDGVRV